MSKHLCTWMEKTRILCKMEMPDISKLVHNSVEYQLCFMHAAS